MMLQCNKIAALSLTERLRDGGDADMPAIHKWDLESIPPGTA
jgi:hypothetical protein